MQPYRVILRVLARVAPRVLVPALCTCLAACSFLSRGAYPGHVTASPAEALRRYAREVHLAHVDREPELRARLNLPWVDRWFARREPERVEVERALLRRELDVLARLHPPERLDADARLEWGLLDERVRGELAALDWLDLDARPHPGRGPHLALLGELAGRPIRTEADIREWVAAASRAADSFERLTRDAVALAEAQRVSPRSAYRAVAAQCRAAVSGHPFRASGPDAPVFATFRARVLDLPELDAERRERWLAEARGVLRDRLGAEVERYAAALVQVERGLPEDRGAWSLPEGDGFYDYRVRRACGVDTSVDEVEARARDLITTARDELGQLARQLDHPGTLESLLVFAREDPRFRLPTGSRNVDGRAALAAGASRLVTTAEKAMDRVVREVPRLVVLLEPRGSDESGPTYTPVGGPREPARWRPDFSDVGAWPRPRLTVEVHRWTWPGRHLRESVLATRSDLARFRRHLVQPAWAAGWDLYAVRVAEEVGLAEDPYDRVARLEGELWVGALALADFGIHRRRWAPKDTLEWLVRTTARPEPECRAAIEGLLLDPGDATAAAWGFQTILGQRERAAEELGPEFDVRAFHDLVIGAGPLSPRFVAARVTAWIEDAR